MKMTKKKFIKALDILWSNDNTLAKSISEQMTLFDEYIDNNDITSMYLLGFSTNHFIKAQEECLSEKLSNELNEFYEALSVCERYSRTVFLTALDHTFNHDECSKF